MSYTDYTLTDAIDGIRRKMNQEHEALQDADVVRAIRVRCRLRALREELYETEVERLSCYQALVPFLPETAQSQPAPMVLQSDPAAYYQHLPQDMVEEPLPEFLSRDLPQDEVGRYGE